MEGCGQLGKVGSFQNLDFGIGKPLNAFKVGERLLRESGRETGED